MSDSNDKFVTIVGKSRPPKVHGTMYQIRLEVMLSRDAGRVNMARILTEVVKRKFCHYGSQWERVRRTSGSRNSRVGEDPEDGSGVLHGEQTPHDGHQIHDQHQLAGTTKKLSSASPLTIYPWH